MSLPAYLLPGLVGRSAHDFSFLAPMLARRHDVTGVDFAPTADFDVLVDQVLALLPAEPVALVGYSLGAAVAIAVAARTPSVERLVLVSGWPGARFAGEWAADPTAAHARRSAYSFDDGLAAPFAPGDLTGARIAMLGALDLGDHAARITAPTMLVAAAHDAISDRTASLHGTPVLPRDTRVVEVDSGHAIVFERPAELLRYVDGFFDGVVREPVTA